MDNTIKIGKVYKNSFDSIIKIVNLCNFSSVNNVPIEVSNNKIKYGENVYEYDNSIMSYESSNIKYEMNKEGASWFSGLRNKEQLVSFDSEWKELIKNIAVKFHTEYSFLELDTDNYQITSKELEDKKKKAMFIINKFFNLDNGELRKTEDSDSRTLDYYGAILKLEISDDTRESQVILCKVFFKKNDDGVFIPLDSEEAKEINNFFLKKSKNNDNTGIKAVDNITDEARLDLVETATDYLTDALIKLINDKNNDFSKYYFLHHESENSLSEDEKIIKSIIDNAPSLGVVNISCKEMSLLSIIHAKWNSVCLGYYVGGRKYLDFEFGLKDKCNVSCSLCKDKETLIYDDMLIYLDSNGEKSKMSIYDTDVSDYVESSLIPNHIILMNNCKARCRNIECRKIVCKSDLIELDGELKCTNCRYPEIVFVGSDNIPRMNRNLVFVSDLNDLKTKEESQKCSLCKRFFVTMSNDLCPLCNALINQVPSENEKKIYKRYSSLLPVNKRAMHAFDKKYGYEDDEIVLIRLDNKRVALIDKLSDVESLKIKYLKIKK